ncbi:MAG: hypothetical protein M1830_006931 [Pleopsidium flavum]|nr:MAG: hypothetical protein M1830_006931 [Pleopsidium flavum]
MTNEGIRLVYGGGFERSSWYELFQNFGTQNMFSFKSSQAHITRRRIYAMNYSKSTISQPHVQNIIKTRISQLIRFIAQQARSTGRMDGKGSPFVVRNLLRALQADVFTAFAFSETVGTNFLNNLDVSRANTSEELGMDVIDLFHEDKRDDFFFWESESPFKYLARLLGWDGPIAHNNAETWVSNLVSGYEASLQVAPKDMHPVVQKRLGNNSVYGKMLVWKNPQTGRQLSWEERASEIMDHEPVKTQFQQS